MLWLSTLSSINFYLLPQTGSNSAIRCLRFIIKCGWPKIRTTEMGRCLFLLQMTWITQQFCGSDNDLKSLYARYTKISDWLRFFDQWQLLFLFCEKKTSLEKTIINISIFIKYTLICQIVRVIVHFVLSKKSLDITKRNFPAKKIF